MLLRRRHSSGTIPRTAPAEVPSGLEDDLSPRVPAFQLPEPDVPGGQAVGDGGDSVMGHEVGRQYLDGRAAGPQFLGEFTEPVGTAGHENEVVVVGQQPGIRGADSGGGAGDEGMVRVTPTTYPSARLVLNV